MFYVIFGIAVKNYSIFLKKSGYAYIGGLRTTRVIYPTDHERLGIKLNRMSNTLTKDDVSLVKVGKNEYYVYTYKGKLNDVKNSLIALY